uniref:Pepsin-I3 domain-containing protein n=1 Tax=Steinernema glaseri TaxID=37863 RepID=A0A1I7Z303_9BILA
MWQTVLQVFALIPIFVLGYSDAYGPVAYSHTYASPGGASSGYASSYASSSAGSPYGGGGTYVSSSRPYSSYYSSSYGDSSGGRPYSSYSSSGYSNHCAYENDVVIENGYTRAMTEGERQLIRNYEREMMNYNHRSASAVILNMNLRFMEQIQDGQFPTIYPFNMNPMPQPPCLCSSCRRSGGYSSSSYRSSYDKYIQ